jgi:hypothetical protein
MDLLFAARPMNRYRTTLLAFLALIPALAHSQNAPRQIRADRVGLYHVDLVCPAAPLIGCGSAAKPLLLELERSTNVSEAWLNRSGTVIGVVWKQNMRAAPRTRILESSLHGQQFVEIKGNPREKLLAEFDCGNGWFRGAQVDRLSEEEAGVIAGRLVRRIGKQITLSGEKSKALEAGITSLMKHKLIDGEFQSRGQLEDQILKTCRQELNENEIAILKKARENGAFANLRGD